MSLPERLKMIMKMHNLTASSFADRIGVQRSSISHIMSGRNKPSLDFIEKTLTSFPKVNAGWLITGKQSITETTKDSTSKEATVAQPMSSDIDTPKTQNVPQRKIDKIVVFYSDGTYEVAKTNS